MNDLNFFAPYTEQRKPKFKPYYYVLIILPLMIGAMAWFYFWSEQQVSNYNKQITASKEYMQLKDTKSSLKIIDENKKKIAILSKYHTEIETINNNAANTEYINSTLISDIRKRVPPDMFMKNMTLNNTGVQIQGISKSRLSIAELEYNIKNLNIFKTVHVLNINVENDQSGNFNFTIKCSY